MEAVDDDGRLAGEEVAPAVVYESAVEDDVRPDQTGVYLGVKGDADRDAGGYVAGPGDGPGSVGGRAA